MGDVRNVDGCYIFVSYSAAISDHYLIRARKLSLYILSLIRVWLIWKTCRRSSRLKIVIII